jgi:hypothetical protein
MQRGKGREFRHGLRHGHHGQPMRRRDGQGIGQGQHHRRRQQMRRLGQQQGGAVQVGPAVAQRVERPLHRHAQVIDRVGHRGHPFHPGTRRQQQTRQIAVIGARLQRFGPPRGDRQFRRPQRAQRRQPFGRQRLGRQRQRPAAAISQHNGHAHAQITACAGKLFDDGQGKRHGYSSSALHIPRRRKLKHSPRL